MKTITSSELSEQIKTSQPPLILDFRLSDDFEAGHLPGAVGNCVFEVSFHDRLEETAPDKSRPVVVCGASSQSQEARMAAEKLIRHGYEEVAVLEGGLASWAEAGLGLEETTPLADDPKVPEGRVALDLPECRVEWVGRNLLNKHFGTIEVTGGHLDFYDGNLKGGEFKFDLRSIKSLDLEGSPAHEVLIGHLLDHDFLDAAEHPECLLVITAAEPIAGSTPGSPNLAITADLTMRGVTETIEFAACSGLTPEGKAAAQASFSIDRTRWGILYGSARFFNRLAGHLVNDLIEFQVRIVTA